MTASDWGDSAPAPTALTARTLNRYAVPLARPVTVCVVVRSSLFGTSVQAVSKAASPTCLTYCHRVIAEPPLPFEVQVSVICRSPPVTAGLLGAGGTVVEGGGTTGVVFSVVKVTPESPTASGVCEQALSL